MRTCGRLVAIALAILALSAGPSAAKVPSSFTIQGLLRDGQGKLQTMPVTVIINIFDADQMGNLLAGPYTQMVKADNGLFTVEVTDANLRSLLASASQVWIEVAVGNDTFPRRRVTAEIFALMAGSAEMADKLSPACSGCVDDSMIAGVTGSKVTGKVPACTNADLAVSFSGNLAGDVTGTQSATKVAGLMGIPIAPQPPTDQQVLKYDGTNKVWLPGSAGGVSNVATGAGLTGGPITTTGTISIAQNGIVPSMVSMGTYGINVAGNAGTVTNGVYNSGTYADPAWLTSLSAGKITGAVPSAMAATNFTGMLTGDVTGTQNATIVQRLNGSPIGNLGAATAGQLLGFDGQKWGPTKSYGDTDVLMAVALAGYLKKSDPIAASQLPPDGLDEVSNNLLTTTFNTTFNSTDTPVTNNPNNGLAQSKITVPDLGLIKTIQVSVNISDPDIGAFKMELVAPDMSSVTLYDHGKPGQKDLVASYDQTSLLPQGSLGTYINKHPTGTWTLKITNNVVGNSETLNSWSLTFVALSGTGARMNGDLDITGNLTVQGQIQGPEAFGMIFLSSNSITFNSNNGTGNITVPVGAKLAIAKLCLPPSSQGMTDCQEVQLTPTGKTSGSWKAMWSGNPIYMGISATWAGGSINCSAYNGGYNLGSATVTTYFYR